MLSRTAEYALRSLVVLARHHGGRPVGVGEIASLVGAPRNYLSKTLNTLVHHGILASVRGPGGGYRLLVAPEDVSVAEVADLFTPARPDGARCLLGDGPCDAAHPCSAHQRWTAIRLSAREPLLHTVLGQLCGAPSLTRE